MVQTQMCVVSVVPWTPVCGVCVGVLEDTYVWCVCGCLGRHLHVVCVWVFGKTPTCVGVCVFGKTPTCGGWVGVWEDTYLWWV